MRPRPKRPAPPPLPSAAPATGGGVRTLLIWLAILMVPVVFSLLVFGAYLVASPASGEKAAAQRWRVAQARALDAEAWGAMSGQAHGVIAKWVNDKPHGFVEALSSDPAVSQWVAKVLAIELVQVRQYRLVSWSDQIVLLVPEKGDPLNKKAQAAYSWLVQQAAPQVDAHAAPTRVFTDFDDEAFLELLSATPVPDGLVKEWRTEWLEGK